MACIVVLRPLVLIVGVLKVCTFSVSRSSARTGGQAQALLFVQTQRPSLRSGPDMRTYEVRNRAEVQCTAHGVRHAPRKADRLLSSITHYFPLRWPPWAIRNQASC